MLRQYKLIWILIMLTIPAYFFVQFVVSAVTLTHKWRTLSMSFFLLSDLENFQSIMYKINDAIIH